LFQGEVKAPAEMVQISEEGKKMIGTVHNLTKRKRKKGEKVSRLVYLERNSLLLQQFPDGLAEM